MPANRAAGSRLIPVKSVEEWPDQVIGQVIGEMIGKMTGPERPKCDRAKREQPQCDRPQCDRPTAEDDGRKRAHSED
jgi:hypothetical protein